MNEREDLRPANEAHTRYLDGLKKCTAHKELVVAAALHFCAEEQIIPPAWVVAASSELICDLLKREKAQTRGRAAGHLARYRQNMWALERWNAVDQIRQLRTQFEADHELLKSHPNLATARQKVHIQKMRQWLRQGTFACASMYLYGRDSRVAADAMKTSHRKVERASKDLSDTQYWYIDPRFLRAIGIDDRIERPGTKFVHLYNLTP